MDKISRRGLVTGAALAPLALAPRQAKAQSPAPAAGGDRFDFVVAGAGHNSLICAAYLSKAGYRVLVLEGRPTIGGGCKTAEVLLPGFKEDLCSSVHGGIQANPVLRKNELNLFDYGLEYIDPELVMYIPFVDGTSIAVWRDLERTCDSIAKVSKKDAETFHRLVPEFKATQEARGDSGAARNGYWQRLNAMSGYDAACVLFESRQMRAASMACGHFTGVPGGDFGTGNQAFSLMGQVLAGRPFPKGGSGMLSVALGRVLEANHAVILTNKPVVQLIIENGKCVGVGCADGSRYRAEKAVVSTIHLKHIVNMAPKELWGAEFTRNLETFQPEHAMFQFHYASKEAPQYPLMGGGTISSTEAVLMESPESILLLNNYNSRGEVWTDDIPLQIVSPTVSDPSRAPAGHHTVKIEGTLPYALKEGPKHWDKIKDEVAERIFARLRRAAPNLTPDKILAKFLESPLDIERMNPAMWRGSAHHGDRRIPQFAPAKMPIAGLYQTGACTAPGGSITGMPGRNSAEVILKDFGMSIEEVAKKGAKA